MATIRIETLDGPIEWPEEDLAALLSLCARARTAHTIPEVEIGAARVDVGGAGVPYGMVRIRQGAGTWRLDEPRISALLAAHAPVVPVSPVPAPPAPPVPPKPPTPPETPRDEPDKVDLILAVLRRKITGGSEVVSDEDFEAVGKWLEEIRERGFGPLLEAASARILRDPKTPPILKARLVQHLAEYALPEMAQALDEGLENEPALRKILESPHVARAFQRRS